MTDPYVDIFTINKKAQEIYRIRNHAEALHAVQCLKGKKCTWKQEHQDLAESHVTGIWVHGEEHSAWYAVAETYNEMLKAAVRS